MLDLILANKLVKAVPPGAHLLLVGDVDQLPSVGAGEVLRDLLAADTIPRVRLTQIFRQAQQSGVVVNAHRINAGQPPVFGEHPDFFLFPADEPEATAERVVDLVARRIPRRFGLAPAGHPGAGADAPRPGRRRQPQHRCCSRPSPRAGTGLPERRHGGAGVPARRQGHPDPQQLRQGRRRGVQRHRRHHHRPVGHRPAAHRAHRRGRGHRLRLRRARRAASTPTRSPCTAPRAANTRRWSSR